jgi:alpha-tubulin suppressor-like RCC1 family protein
LQGRLYTWGIGTFYQLGHGNNSDQPKPMLVEALRTVQIVQSSCTRGEKYGHTGAVDVDGRVYTWGCGYKGKLGHYKEWTHEDPADEPLPKLI